MIRSGPPHMLLLVVGSASVCEWVGLLSMLVSSHEIIDPCISEVTKATIVHTTSKLESAKVKHKGEDTTGPTC